MSPFILAVLGVSLFLTALLSGVFGMAGGMILLGVLLALFSVADAMVLHGIAQMASNGWRVVLHFANVRWAIVAHHALGAMLALAVFVLLGITLGKAWVFLSLGAVALLAIGLPPSWTLDATRRVHAVVCGLTTTALHLMAGVAGPMLDLFFIRAPLNRHEIVATKAMVQTGSHILKVIYFAFLVGSGLSVDFPAWVYVMIVALAFAGAFAGRMILARFSDDGFRFGMKVILGLVGAVYILRGLTLLVNV